MIRPVRDAALRLSSGSRWILFGSLALALTAPATLLAVPSEDGDIVLTANGTPAEVVLNSYTPLAVARVGGATFLQIGQVGIDALRLPTCPGNATCSNATDMNGMGVVPNNPGTPLASGDLLMIYQPQDTNAPDSAINTTDTASFGSVNSLEQAGLYEFVYVRSVV